MRSVRVALAVGLALTAVALAVVLSGSPVTVAGTNSVPATSPLGLFPGGTKGCQQSGTVPGGTSAIRMSLSTGVGPSVTVTVFSGSSVLTRGERRAGWGINDSVTVPVARVAQTTPDTRLCLALGPTIQPVEIKGGVVQAATPNGGTRAVSRFRIEYLRADRRSWWSLASSVARRMGLGHAPGGTWIVFLEIALMIAVAFLASWSMLRATASRQPAVIAGPDATSRPSGGLRVRAILRRVRASLRPVPRAAWVCALVAFLNAVCWSLITPPFQVPDEPSHFAYVQQVAETGTLPTSDSADYSEEQIVAQRDLRLEIRFHPEEHPVATPAQQRRLQHDLAQPLGRSGGGGAGVAASQPPLYYALEAIPYDLGSSGSLLDRLELMRLLSALLAGVTALFAYLFVREALPGVAWAWIVGGLGVALTPLLGFMSGSVNPDSMLYAVSAVTFYLLARAFRRGLTPRLAAAIGVVTAIGFLTKLNFIGLVPGVVVGLVVLALRAPPAARRSAYRSLALALAIAASPALLYIVINLLSNRPGLGEVSSAIHLNGAGSVFGEAGYIWQFFLPRLPGMTRHFVGVFPPRDIWFDRSVGLYGWLDTTFPVWVQNIALIPAVLIAILAVRALFKVRATLRRRLLELAVYAVMGVGVVVLIGADQYLTYRANKTELYVYAEPRYLLPMLPLLGAAFALSARGAGRRWGPAVGALLVTLFLAHDLLSQLQVIARYYG